MDGEEELEEFPTRVKVGVIYNHYLFFFFFD